MIVGIGRAKAVLSQILDQVEKGEAVTITRRGRPVAVLLPIDPARANADIESIAKSTQDPRSDPASPLAPSDPTIVPQRSQNPAGERKSYGLTLAELTAASR